MSQEPESKFSSFLAARRESGLDVEPVLSSRVPPVAPSRGRPTGKRRDPAFEQVTAYIRRDTHHAVKVALLKEARNRQFSDLVETLLAEWLTKATHNFELPPI